MAKVFKRKIVDTKFLPSQWQWGKLQGSNIFTLECGHTQSAKQSAGIPASGFKNCQECQNLANGTIITHDFKGPNAIRESWDSEKQWPKREKVNPEIETN